MATIELHDIERMKAVIKKAPALAAIRYIAALKIAGNLIRVNMKKEAPRKSGVLQRSIKLSVSGMTAKIGPNLRDAPYAIYVHMGTGIYGKGGRRIRPRNKQALYWKGALHPVKSVKGQRANPFVDRTAKGSEVIVREVFFRATNNLVKEIAKASTA